MSLPLTPRKAITSVEANINPADKSTAAVGVACCRLVRSSAAGSSLPWAMRMSTRAAAVVHARTQANMLMAAPMSMATPSGETPALPARRCRGLVVSLSFPDSPRKPRTSE